LTNKIVSNYDDWLLTNISNGFCKSIFDDKFRCEIYW